MKIRDSQDLLNAIRRCLPFIDNAHALCCLLPEIADSAQCRAAVEDLRAVLTRIEEQR